MNTDHSSRPPGNVHVRGINQRPGRPAHCTPVCWSTVTFPRGAQGTELRAAVEGLRRPTWPDPCSAPPLGVARRRTHSSERAVAATPQTSYNSQVSCTVARYRGMAPVNTASLTWARSPMTGGGGSGWRSMFDVIEHTPRASVDETASAEHSSTSHLRWPGRRPLQWWSSCQPQHQHVQPCTSRDLGRFDAFVEEPPCTPTSAASPGSQPQPICPRNRHLPKAWMMGPACTHPPPAVKQQYLDPDNWSPLQSFSRVGPATPPRHGHQPVAATWLQHSK